MPLVEHAQIKNDSSKHAALASSKQESTCDQASERLDGAHTSTDDAPGNGQKRKVFPSSDDLQKPVRWDVDEDVEDVEHGEGDVVLVPGKIKVVDEAVDFGIADLFGFVK